MSISKELFQKKKNMNIKVDKEKRKQKKNFRTFLFDAEGIKHFFVILYGKS